MDFLSEFKNNSKNHLQSLITELIKQKCSQEMQQGFLEIINHFVKFLQKDTSSNLSTCRTLIESSLKLFFDSNTKMKLVEMENQFKSLEIEMLYHHLHFVRSFGNVSSHGCKTLEEYEIISVISSTVCVLELLIANHSTISKKLNGWETKQNQKVFFINGSNQNSKQSNQINQQSVFQSQNQNQEISNQNQQNLIQQINQTQQFNKFKPMEKSEIKSITKEMRSFLKNPPYSMKTMVLFSSLSKDSQKIINTTVQSFEYFLKNLCSEEFIVSSDLISNCKVHVQGDPLLISQINEMIEYFTEKFGDVEFYNLHKEGVAFVKFKTHDGFKNALSTKFKNMSISPLQ
jgi:hypothetical protein